jgi:hypothetical protein
VVVRWIIGFGLAAYVAIPNYGLFQESSIPYDEQMRDLMISWLPLARIHRHRDRFATAFLTRRDERGFKVFRHLNGLSVLPPKLISLKNNSFLTAIDRDHFSLNVGSRLVSC